MLTPRVRGRKGRYMSQQLDLVSCCLGVASRRFNNFESGMALHTIEESSTELTQDMCFDQNLLTILDKPHSRKVTPTCRKYTSRPRLTKPRSTWHTQAFERRDSDHVWTLHQSSREGNPRHYNLPGSPRPWKTARPWVRSLDPMVSPRIDTSDRVVWKPSVRWQRQEKKTRERRG